MKLLKKLMVVFVAVLMTLSLGSRIYAESEDASDDYKVDFAVDGIEDGNTLVLYKIGTPLYNSDTNEMTYSFVDGLGYTEAQLGAITSDGMVYIPGSDAKALADDLANKIAKGSVTPSATVNVVSSGKKATVDNLPAGYYVAVVTGTKDDGILYQNMIVNAMPVVQNPGTATAAYAAATIADFNVKSTPVKIEKEVGTVAKAKTTDGYSLGDDVPFKITTNIPNYPTPSKEAKFIITDTPNGVTLNNTTEKPITVTVADDASYTVTTADIVTIDLTGNVLTITFDPDYILENAGKAVTVTYTGKLVGTPDANGKTADNIAKIEYNPNPNIDQSVKPDDKTEVFTYGFVFNKVDDSTTPAALEGAVFTLYESDGKTEVLDENGKPLVSTSTKVGDKAYVYFKGLKAGTYKAIETSAPAGYKTLTDPVEVEVSKTLSTQDNPATTDVTEKNYTVVSDPVVNTKGAELPSTGGIGTTIFHIAGAALVLGAGILLISKKRMNNN